MTEGFITEAHLQAVRSELQARLAEHKAEVNVTMRELTTEVRNSRAEHQRQAVETKAALERLVDSVNKLEGGEEREQWMADLKNQIVRKTAAGLTLAATVGGLVIALIQHFTG